MRTWMEVNGNTLDVFGNELRKCSYIYKSPDLCTYCSIFVVPSIGFLCSPTRGSFQNHCLSHRRLFLSSVPRALTQLVSSWVADANAVPTNVQHIWVGEWNQIGAPGFFNNLVIRADGCGHTCIGLTAPEQQNTPFPKTRNQHTW